MYFQTLGDFEAIMRGHELAYMQMDAIEEGVSFQVDFSNWLHERKRVSAAGGWSLAIQELAESADRSIDDEFSDHVQKFLAQWND